MSFFTGLYNMLMGPLELLFEFIFFQVFRILQNPGLTIIALSLMMNFLVLPLYKRADDMQAEQHNEERKLSPGVSHIRKTFRGDERYMMLQTFYRQNHYKPVYALRGTVSLLLEIPFFIAAYNVLSNMNVLQGSSFGPIANLGVPDGMLQLGGLAVNLLPIAMTAINIVTCMLYTKGLPMKSKLQLYGMALIFLVLLYDSPSGLVFYWTLNNVFSLFKTIFYKLRHPGRVLGILSSVLGAAGLIFVTLIHPLPSVRSESLAVILVLCLQLPLVWQLTGRWRGERKAIETDKTDHLIFFCACGLLTVVTGLLIPSGLIAASPEEFINLKSFTNPIQYIVNCLLVSIGTFLVWFGIFYRLAGQTGKKFMGYGAVIGSFCAVVDFLFFGTDYGIMSPELKFDRAPAFTGQLLNLLVLAALAVALLLLLRYRRNAVKNLAALVCLTGVILSVPGLVKTQRTVSDRIDSIQNSMQEPIHISLSRQSQNVVVIMMDRAINDYIPFLFAERPELRKQFAGFTHYPNTVSYGPFTNFGAPGLYGGYEYIPEEMNRRDTEKLEDKHNESLKVMPVSFLQQDFQVTVCDPSYAGYHWLPDLSIYDEYPQIKTYITQRPRLQNPDEVFWDVRVDMDVLYRNLFCYSLFKAAPVVLQPYFYTDGSYNDLNVLYFISDGEEKASADGNQICTGISTAVGSYSDYFWKGYHALENFPEMMEVVDSDRNTFMMISNELTHAPVLLQEPDYVPSDVVDNREYDAAHMERFRLGDQQLHMNDVIDYSHYQVNMASMILLGRWFDYLRENDVYDNTRIIIVADHGAELNELDSLQMDDPDLSSLMIFRPLLMVKDFGSKEFQTDPQFMTNADVPSLAMEGLIENPINPFTGNPVNMDHKKEPVQKVFFSYETDVTVNNGYTFLPGIWYHVPADDAMNPAAWQRAS